MFLLSRLPLLARYLAEPAHDCICAVLKDRFGSDPLDVRKLLDPVTDQRKLRKLAVFAASCRDVDAFREALLLLVPFPDVIKRKCPLSLTQRQIMSKEDAFLKAISAEPNDTAIRLIYADWLDEQNDPRAAFLRVQVRLRELSADDESYSTLLAQEQVLRMGCPPRWLAILDPAVWCIVGNIVAEHASGPGGADIRHGTRLFRPNAKIYLVEPHRAFAILSAQTADRDARVRIVGQQRKSRQWIGCIVRGSYTTNWRVALEYHPGVKLWLHKEQWPGFLLRKEDFTCPEDRGQPAIRELFTAFETVWKRRLPSE